MLYLDILRTMVVHFDWCNQEDQWIVSGLCTIFSCSIDTLLHTWKKHTRFETIEFRKLSTYDRVKWHTSPPYIPVEETFSLVTILLCNGKVHTYTVHPTTNSIDYCVPLSWASTVSPAVIVKGVLFEWWQNGKPHRTCVSAKTGLVLPAIISIDNDDNINKQWWQNGQLHRTCKDPQTGQVLPAIEKKGQQEWWYKGQRHRDCRDLKTRHVLPAVISTDKSGNMYKEWWVNGKCLEKRAFVSEKKVKSIPLFLDTKKMLYSDILGIVVPYLNWPNLEDQSIVSELGAIFSCSIDTLLHAWKKHTRFKKIEFGKLNRYDREKWYNYPPYIQQHYSEKRLASITILLCNGKVHGHPTPLDFVNDEYEIPLSCMGAILPAVIMKGFRYEWWQNGKLHRTCINPKTGCILPAVYQSRNHQEWWQCGKRHRTCVHPKTGLILPAICGKGYKQWWQNGVRHRTCKDPRTGHVLPAVDAYSQQEWWHNGKRHRTCIHRGTDRLLPAIKCTLFQEWWINGERIDYAKV